jgi:hypothetical protein
MFICIAEILFVIFPANMSLRYPSQNYLIMLLLAAVAACSEPVEKVAHPEQDVSGTEECIVWSHNDSATMEVVYLANTYVHSNRTDKAGVLFRHAATMPHDLPGIAMNAGLLTKDTLKAESYFRMEIEHDRRVMGSALPDCRKYEFLVTMYRCYRLLGEPQKADSILKHYGTINNQATPSGNVMRGAWALY